MINYYMKLMIKYINFYILGVPESNVFGYFFVWVFNTTERRPYELRVIFPVRKIFASPGSILHTERQTN